MNHTILAFLWRLIEAGPSERRASAAAQELHQRYRLGVRNDRIYTYDQAAVDHAANILRSHGQPPRRPVLESADRAGASRLAGLSEKTGTQKPRENLVAVRPLSPGCELAGEPLPSRMTGFLALDLEDAAAVRCDALLYVENLETLRQLHRYAWLAAYAPLAGQRVLAVYRGDDVFRLSKASQLLTERSEPVWAFPDADPAGLALASTLPRLAGLTLPWERLEEVLRACRRSDLYHSQIGQYRATLEACSHPDVQRAWNVVHRTEYGLVQEALRDL